MDPRSLEAAPKVALTAVVLIPPETIWEPIQAIRSAHDPQFVRWMPHVTLLYPFVPETRLDEAAALLTPAAATVEPFEATLASFGHFVHGRGSATLWLRPEPSDRLIALQAALAQAMPWCDDVGRFPGGFTPHLSVGRFPNRTQAEAMAERLLTTWTPLRFRALQVALIARPGPPGAPFAVRTRLPLATGNPAEV